ncbi:MAG: hypothetical protein ACRD8U_05010 [Pyrinomonadaceae bacterium]
MEAPEKEIEGTATPARPVTPWLLRLFALVALLFGLMHLGDGLSELVKTLSRQHNVFIFQIQTISIFVDLVFGVALLVIAVGLFFLKNWARKSWLVLLAFMLVIWIHLTIMKYLAGYTGVSTIYPWIVILLLVSIVSWTYLTRERVRALYR